MKINVWKRKGPPEGAVYYECECEELGKIVCVYMYLAVQPVGSNIQVVDMDGGWRVRDEEQISEGRGLPEWHETSLLELLIVAGHPRRCIEGLLDGSMWLEEDENKEWWVMEDGDE